MFPMQKGMPMEPVYYPMQGPQHAPPPFPGNQGGMPMQPQQFNNPIQQLQEESSEEMQRQMYGEQLYVSVQQLTPSAYLAQKITGMLLELPLSELFQNLTNQEELHRRVQEAVEVLKNDGLDG